MSVFAVSNAAPKVGMAQLIPERIEEGFEKLKYSLRHKLMVASGNGMMRHLPRGDDTRFIPCTWGVRRDDYQWRSFDDVDDLIAFRAAAAAMAQLIHERQLAAWAKLIPGTMQQTMGTTSALYLADYWVLTLHYLVWSKQLPYAIEARWMQGTTVHDERFYFVSELPVNIVEASQDAMILFREAAIHELASRHCMPRDFKESIAVHVPEPPVCRDGKWCLRQVEPEESDEIIEASVDPIEEIEMPQETKEEAHELVLSEQTFTITDGAHRYRFTQRNKQLFSLLARIHRRPGHHVDFDALRQVGDVWDGSPVEDSTIRGAVARLRKILKRQGFNHVARRITTGTYQGHGYVVLLTEDLEEF